MTNGEYKQLIIKHLQEQGYITYADRFTDFKFFITEMYKGSYCGSAFMVPDEGVIVINPGFFRLQNPNDPREQKEAFDRISVLIRHELLHFLLTHEQRFIKYLKKKYPDSWGRLYANPDMHRIANFAMDYDICNEAYEPVDKDIIRNLTLNGQFIGGLITEDQVNGGHTSIWFDDGTKEEFSGSEFNNWEKMPMEDMWQKLKDAHDAYKAKQVAPGGDKPQGQQNGNQSGQQGGQPGSGQDGQENGSQSGDQSGQEGSGQDKGGNQSDQQSKDGQNGSESGNQPGNQGKGQNDQQGTAGGQSEQQGNQQGGQGQGAQPSNTKDKEYDDMYNKVLSKFKDDKVAAEELLGRLMAGEEIDIDTWHI